MTAALKKPEPAPEPAPEQVPGPDWPEVERRIKAHEANPDEALDWDDFITQFRAEHGCA